MNKDTPQLYQSNQGTPVAPDGTLCVEMIPIPKPRDGQFFHWTMGWVKPVAIQGWLFIPAEQQWGALVVFPDGSERYARPKL